MFVTKENRMKLIKLGAAYLNMDLMTDAWVDGGRVTVFFAVPAMYSAAPFHEVSNAVTTREVRFSGAQAAALIDWLQKRAKDLTPDFDEAEDIEVRAAVGDLVLTEYETVDDGPGS